MFSVIGQPVFLLGPQELSIAIPVTISNAMRMVFFMFFIFEPCG